MVVLEKGLKTSALFLQELQGLLLQQLGDVAHREAAWWGKDKRYKIYVKAKSREGFYRRHIRRYVNAGVVLGGWTGAGWLGVEVACCSWELLVKESSVWKWSMICLECFYMQERKIKPGRCLFIRAVTETGVNSAAASSHGHSGGWLIYICFFCLSTGVTSFKQHSRRAERGTEASANELSR